jgi:hypothetical protein
MSKPEITMRPATLKDIEAFFGRKPDRTVKAMVVEKDGELACIAGVTIGKNYIEAFSDMKPLDVPKRTIWRYAKQLKAMLDEYKLPCIATTNNPKFLLKLGFRHVGEYYGKQTFRLDYVPSPSRQS